MSDSATEPAPKNNNNETRKQNGHVLKELKETNEIVDPFFNDVLSKLTPLKKVQIAFMSIFIVPFRLLLVLLDLLILWIVGHWIIMFQTEEEKLYPVRGWKKHIGYPIAKFFCRILFFLGGFHWIQVKGTPDMNVPIMVFAPHSGFFDSLLVVYLNFVSVIGRAGADEVLVFGNLTRLCQPIIVDRDAHKSRTESVKKVIDRVNSELDWPPLSVYPEGTCTNRKELVLFKSGAFISGLPVQPICIKYGDNEMDTISWTWEGPHPFTLCWLLLCQVNLPVEFNFLPVYHPNEDEKKNADLYAENVRKLMAKELKMGLSELSYEDGRLRMLAKKHKLIFKIGDVKVQALRKKYGINTDTIFEMVNTFAQLADRKTGLCHLDNFAKNLGIKLNEPVNKLFEIFDVEKCGNITLARFIHIYFDSIYMELKKEKTAEQVSKVIQVLDKFQSANHCSRNELVTEFNEKFNIQIEDIEKLMKLNSQEVSKDVLEQFLSKNLLILYLVAVLAKNI